MIYVLLIIQSIMLVAGQTLWKIELDKYPSITKQNFWQILFSPNIIGGLFIYGCATLLWFYIISVAKDKFSMVYPFGSLAYVLGIVVAILIFKESVPYTRWIGMGFVILGLVFIAKQ